MKRIGYKPDPEELEKVNKYIASFPSGRRWLSDSSPEIAKGIYTAVSPQYRRRGIATKLLHYRDSVLVERGVKRVDGRIEIRNVPQIRALHKEGGRIERSSDMLFVTRYLI